MRYDKTPVTFKLSPYAGVYRDSVGKSFALALDLGPMIQMIFDGIADARIPFARSQDFSLINVLLVDHQSSIGYSSAPPESTIAQNASVVATFALSSKPCRDLSFGAALGQGKITRHRVWNDRVGQRYLTVSLSKLELDRVGLRNIRPESLTNLYNQIGFATKNYVTQVKSSIVPPADFPDQIEDLSTRYLTRYGTLKGLVNNVPVTKWPYTVQFWAESSNLFIEDTVPKRFPLYWCLYLNSRVYAPSLSVGATAYVDSKVCQFVADGINQLQIALGTTMQPYEIKDELLALMVLLLDSSVDESFEGKSESDLQILVGKYLGKVLRSAAQAPEFKQQLSSLLGARASRTLASSLLDGPMSGVDVDTLFELVRGAAKADI